MIPVLLKIKKIVTPIVRGALKGSPMINGVVEAIRNRKGVNVEVTTESGDIVKGTAKNIHKWSSIIMQLAVSGAFIYLFLTGKITKDSLLEFLAIIMNAQGN